MHVQRDPIAAAGAEQQAKRQHAGIKGLEQGVGRGRVPEHDTRIPEQPLPLAHAVYRLR